MVNLGLADTIRSLRTQGYAKDYNLSQVVLDSKTGQIRALDDELVIDHVFRFDIMSDPDDQSILYAIHSTKTGTKGILVNGFGIYTEPQVNQFADLLIRNQN